MLHKIIVQILSNSIVFSIVLVYIIVLLLLAAVLIHLDIIPLFIYVMLQKKTSSFFHRQPSCVFLSSDNIWINKR